MFLLRKKERFILVVEPQSYNGVNRNKEVPNQSFQMLISTIFCPLIDKADHHFDTLIICFADNKGSAFVLPADSMTPDPIRQLSSPSV